MSICLSEDYFHRTCSGLLRFSELSSFPADWQPTPLLVRFLEKNQELRNVKSQAAAVHRGSGSPALRLVGNVVSHHDVN
ncbi:hypothetical protein A6R68_09573 [Neotoma lepida]|uniref:Uncharacterized protein n=1 Tax=Neotoma lepida TaxID=56216 RepID=A0A1A6FZE7_NEOLE|nr:hypothetical protein A6R68_09573 [Neotoma lepida]